MPKIKTSLSILKQSGPKRLVMEMAKYILSSNNRIPTLARQVDKVRYQKLIAYLTLNYWPDIREPQSFNEKVMYRMLFEDKNLYSIFFDKLDVRDYVTERVGKSVLPEIHYATNAPASIPFDSLPDSYVMKSSIGSGQNKVVDSKVEVDTEELRAMCHEWIDKDYYSTFAVKKGQYCFDFENIEPRIVIEERLHGHDQDIPRDYKFYVFDGSVEYIHLDHDRFGEHSRRFYDRNWNPQDFTVNFPLGPIVEPPEMLDEMIAIAEQLGEEMDFIRVDLYFTQEQKVVFGELTPAPGAGREPFDPQRKDFELGDLWKI
jgi:hypothetical protein